MMYAVLFRSRVHGIAIAVAVAVAVDVAVDVAVTVVQLITSHLFPVFLCKQC